MATLNDTLTQQLHRIRTQKAFSAESMAEKLGLSPEAYTKIENGETELTLKGVENIAKALEVSVSELLNAHSTIVFSGEVSHTLCDVNGSSNSHTYYMGVSSEVLEKLLKRIDTLEAELEVSRNQP